MPTTARRTARPRKNAVTPKGDVREETLDQFSKAIDKHAGHRVGFAAMVRELAEARAQLAELKAARKEWYEKVREAYDAGHTVVAGGGYSLALTAVSEPVTYRAVASDEVKKRAPAAWQRAQTEVRFVSVKAPVAARRQWAAVAAPEVPRNATVAQIVTGYKEHPAWALMSELRETEAETIERLDKVAADFGWDGMAITLADGWTVGLRRRQFSSEKLAEVAPDVFERMAVTKVRQSAPRVVVKAGNGADEGVVDLDGE